MDIPTAFAAFEANAARALNRASVQRSQERIAFVDGLRGLAVLMVLVYHLTEQRILREQVVVGLTFATPPIVRAGLLGVDVFFFISGFALFVPYARHLFEGGSRPGLAQFVRRRTFKIVPSYVLVVVVVALLAPVDVPQGDSVALHVAAHLGFVHGFWPPSFVSIVGPLWSLAVEAEFYVLFPVLAALWLRDARFGFALMLGVAVCYRGWLLHSGNASTFAPAFQLPAFFDLFAAGMAVAYAYVRARSRNWWIARNAAAATGLSFGAGALLVVLWNTLATGISGGAPTWVWMTTFRAEMALLLGLFVLGGLFAVPLYRETFANRATLFLALISYNLYLWNKPLVLAMARTSSAFERVPYGNAAHLVVTVALCIAVAWAATVVIERPFLRLGGSARKP